MQFQGGASRWLGLLRIKICRVKNGLPMEQADLVAAIHDMQVSGNRATPKSSSFMRFSLAETIQLLGYGTIQISGGVNGTF